MKIGRMRHSVVLQRFTTVRASDGGELKSWEDVATVAADIAFGTGRELFAARAIDAELTHMVTIRYYRGITPAWRIRFDDQLEGGLSRYFDIHGIEAVGTKRRYQRLQCSELVGTEAQS